ncbi:MAG: type III pantothenate kinase [Phycisphaerales bacterium JB063]
MSNVNLLAVSVGNTRTRVGSFVDGKLLEVSAFVNARSEKIGAAIDTAYAPLVDRPDASILLSTVDPDRGDAVETIIRKQLDQEVYRVERDMPIPVGRQLDREAIVGEDRLLNAAAAYDKLKQSCVIVDAGTAMTVDLVDGEGTFHGGAIVPGAQLMLDALGQRAAQLPEIELRKPEEVVGHNTAEAMLSGVFYGMRGIVRELVEQYATETGQFPLVLATGGDAQVLFRDCDIVERVVPDLTLWGIAVTLRTALEQAEG